MSKMQFIMIPLLLAVISLPSEESLRGYCNAGRLKIGIDQRDLMLPVSSSSLWIQKKAQTLHTIAEAYNFVHVLLK